MDVNEVRLQKTRFSVGDIGTKAVYWSGCKKMRHSGGGGGAAAET